MSDDVVQRLILGGVILPSLFLIWLVILYICIGVS